MSNVVVVLKPGFSHLFSVLTEELEALGLKLLDSKKVILTKDQVYYWRQNVAKKPYFEEMVEYHCSGECLAMLWEGRDAIKKVMSYRGDFTDDTKTGFRGKHGESPVRNVLHVSTMEELSLDISVFFPALLESKSTL